jgi:hypothetical protein
LPPEIRRRIEAIYGRDGLSPSVCAEYVQKFCYASWVPSASRTPPTEGLVLPVDALGVDPEQHLDGVASPLGDLRGRHSPVEPS